MPNPLHQVPFERPQTEGQESEVESFAALLPATSRGGARSDHVEIPQLTLAFLQRELLVDKINAVQEWLWICGRPMPPRPLHYQIVLSREIVIAESPDLHLVWSKNRLFLKPIPRWILNPDLWSRHIFGNRVDRPRDADLILQYDKLTACARGFLFSYCALIAYESDFRIALEKGLLPPETKWEDWKALTKQILQDHCFGAVNPRYWYGELRLSRLNKIYKFRKGYLMRGYSKVAAHTVYMDLIRDNFGVLAGVLGYVVIVLTAMQVALGVERLQTNQTFQDVSYGFSVFSILAPLIGAFLVMLSVVFLFVGHWRATKRYEAERFRDMGVEKPGKHKGNAYVGVTSSSRDASLLYEMRVYD